MSIFSLGWNSARSGHQKEVPFGFAGYWAAWWLQGYAAYENRWRYKGEAVRWKLQVKDQ